MTTPPETTAEAAPKPVDLTVVVITFNRAKMLADTLASLVELRTEMPDGEAFSYEIVVVDNASTDETQEVIGRYESTDQRGSATQVRSFYETTPGVAPARNRGMAESVGEWIAFHDDDQKAHPHWLAQLLHLAKRRNLKVAGGAVRLELPENNTRVLSPQCRTLLGERVGWDVEQPYTRKRIPGTNNFLVHRSVIEDVGGFDPTLKVGGTDADLYRRIRTAGYEAWYTPEAIVYHVIPEKRLADDYMKWTATRHGQHLAVREYREWGPLKLTGMIGVRTAQALVNYLPRYLVASLGGDPEETLGKRALLWRSEGYLKRALYLLRHGDDDEAVHGEKLDFRKGRELLMKGPSGPTAS